MPSDNVIGHDGFFIEFPFFAVEAVADAPDV
jgi:hypothetical protein